MRKNPQESGGESEVQKEQLIINLNQIESALSSVQTKTPKQEQYLATVSVIKNILMEGHESNYGEVGRLVATIRTKVEETGVKIE